MIDELMFTLKSNFYARRVTDLSLELKNGYVIATGKTKTYHNKQMVSQNLLEIMKRFGFSSFCVKNEIFVEIGSHCRI